MKLFNAFLATCAMAAASASVLRVGQGAEISEKRLLLSTPVNHSPVLSFKANKASKVSMCFEPSKSAASCALVADGDVVVPSAVVRMACG